MKLLKRILYIFLSLIALILIAGLILPKENHYHESIEINQHSTTVFQYLKLIKNQNNYGTWQLSDPEAKYSEQGTDGTVGYKIAWDGNKIGEGSQTIVTIAEGDSIVTALDFGMGGEPTYSTFQTTAITDNKTKVDWYVKGKTPYPFNVLNPIIDMGEDFRQGLHNLKNILEKEPKQ